MPKSIKRVISKSFDVTGIHHSGKEGKAPKGGKEKSPSKESKDQQQNQHQHKDKETGLVKRSSMQKLFHSNSQHDITDNTVSAPLSQDGGSMALTAEDLRQGRRSSMGNVMNHTLKASGQVMMTTVLAPMAAGKAVLHGSAKAIEGSVKAGQLVVDQSIKTSTNVVKAGAAAGSAVGNSFVQSGKAVGRGGKAIVGGTGAVVEYSGKKLVKSTKGMVKGIKSAATLKGFQGRPPEEKKSKWEKGIEVIESLLEPGSDTYEAMTPEQRKELASVKKLLITAPGGANKIQHVPRDLIKMKKRDSFSVGDRRLSSNFILQEYAGLKDASLLGDGSELDTSESSDSNHDGSETPVPNGNSRSSKAPSNKTTNHKRTNSHQSLGSLGSLQRGFGVMAHDDPELDVLNFVPVEFKQISRGDQMELFGMLAWNSINRWDFDIFRLNKITKGRPLLFMGWAILGSPYAQSAMAKEIGLDYEMNGDESDREGYPFMDELMIPPQKLCDYLRVIEQDYRAENPYHNAIHASDVMQSLHTLIQMSLEEEFLRDCPSIKLFTILLSAAIHDVDHPGKTNAFFTQMRTELAVMYNDTSVLENWHVAHAFARMLNIELNGSKSVHHSQVIDARRSEELKDSDTNILCNAHPEQFKTIRNLMIEAVLHTDMTKHFEMVNNAKALLRQENKEDNTWKVLMFMLHMADISGQAKADPLFKQWTARCMDEFFAQGDEEAALGLPISPNCNRKSTVPAESQVGFIKFVVEPAYEVLGMFVPFVQHQVLPIIHRNLDYWLEQMDAGVSGDDQESSDMEDSSRRADSSEKDIDGSDRSDVDGDGPSAIDTSGVACKDETVPATSVQTANGTNGIIET